MKKILISGGAGYIGSHIAYHAYKAGYTVIVLDACIHNQPTAHITACAELIRGDYRDTDLLNFIFKKHEIDTVIHCAGRTEVGLSVTQPLTFYRENVAKTITLLETMVMHNVKKIQFSSSCAVYGIPTIVPIPVTAPCAPISPYGQTKAMIEQIIKDAAQAYGLYYGIFRYFNVYGCCNLPGFGEYHDPETHLIPLLERAAKIGKPFNIYGTDYPTLDGTAVRDYIHVTEVAKAHINNIETLEQKSFIKNIGSGIGASVLEIIQKVEERIGKKIITKKSSRRLGDPARLIAQL